MVIVRYKNQDMLLNIMQMAFSVRKEAEVNEKFVRIHRIGLEKRDREGFTALFNGNIADAIEKFSLAERHCRKLAVLLQSTVEKNRALEGSLELSNRVANLRALNNGNGIQTGAAMLKLLVELKREY